MKQITNAHEPVHGFNFDQLEDELRIIRKTGIDAYLIYSPEVSVLRPFQEEGQIQPLGINGQGLLAHLARQAQKKKGKFWERLNEALSILDWFGGFSLPKNPLPGEARLEIIDRYGKKNKPFDQRSANEGFLFLLFYFALFLSEDTPKFFAIDNVDASLNPRLSSELMRRLVGLAKENGKQVILTTHNPGLLDGLDLDDLEQKLYAISRSQTVGPPRGRSPRRSR
ncbi:MAG: AAA family ATPase [Verrucomicrobiales bacterium]